MPRQARMTTAAININFENQVNQNIAILQLQAELDARDTEMTAAEMNDAEDTRKPHLTSGTSIEELAKHGLIVRAIGNYTAATVLPIKKDAYGNYTDCIMCGNYRMLNMKTEQDRNPMPIPEDIFDNIEGCQYFTIMDMRQGFNQFEMQPEDKEKTAF